jgi:hypothetical protein
MWLNRWSGVAMGDNGNVTTEGGNWGCEVTACSGRRPGGDDRATWFGGHRPSKLTGQRSKPTFVNGPVRSCNAEPSY